ncbi:autophagy-related protein 7 [Hordeum vulgare]|nr:autophagy-related protein 7 [Hordeum vulgare]
MAGMDGVLRREPRDAVRELHTMRTREFLGLDQSEGLFPQSGMVVDVVIRVLDTENRCLAWEQELRGRGPPDPRRYGRLRRTLALSCYWFLRNGVAIDAFAAVEQDMTATCSARNAEHETLQPVALSATISSSVEDIIKGKSPVVPNQSSPPCKAAPSLPWPRPPEGMVALSVDGSYATSDGSAGTGMILRKPSGDVFFAAYLKLFHCNDALEAELQAIHEGVKLAAERSEATIMLQSDRVTAINAITGVR